MLNTMDHKQIWEDTLKEIQNEVSVASFKTWFKDTFIYKYNDGVVYVGVPNTFVKDWFYKKFSKNVLKILRDLSEEIRSVEFVVSKSEKAKQNTLIIKKSISGQNNTELPLSEFYINKDSNLNPKYTFESFVVGPFNELAYAASQAIIKQPGIIYNPLFVYGNTGHGKTHLIQAVGNQIKNNFPEKKIFYLTSDQFSSDFVYSVQNNKQSMFKDKYKKYDVLIMDDVQFLSNKERTQDELFHLFNYLYENNKQIIFSSDQHPNYIQNLEDRLKSRFNQGMIVDIPKPDHESRMSILRNKALKNNINLPEETLSFLAVSVAGNIRELEGVVNSIACQVQLKNRDLNIVEIREIIKNNTQSKKMISVDELIRIIAGFYNIDEKSISEKTRRKEVVRPRQIIMYLLREEFNVSFPTIGEKMGGRDHTTVIHSCEKIKKDLKVDHTLVQQINQIKSLF
jgi:chromosomal replication initiator protein